MAISCCVPAQPRPIAAAKPADTTAVRRKPAAGAAACRPSSSAPRGGLQQAAAARQHRRLCLRAAAWPDDDEDELEDEPDADDDFELEDEGELDEADFVDMDQVKIMQGQEERAQLWDNYYTRFVSPSVLTGETKQRTQRPTETIGDLLARLPGASRLPQQQGELQPSAFASGAEQDSDAPLLAALRRNAALEDEAPPEENDGLKQNKKIWRELWSPPPEQMDEWDLRALVEKRRRKEREWAAWLEERERVGQHVNTWSDWRTDARITGTSDPTNPDYREWTHREIWDFITQNGRAADPRVVRHRVAPPTEMADFVEQGAWYHPETHDWIASLGRMIPEGEEDGIVDPEAEAALLDAEFSDFDAEFDKELGGDYETYEDAVVGDDF